MTSLLATIVATRRLQPEPVATDALVHLCATSEAASAVMSELLSELCPGSSSLGLVFTGQEINPATEGRPDLVASDPEGTRLVVEAKFDANLTAAQTGGAYLSKLTPGVPGALVFLVPRDRMLNVWRTVTVTPGGQPEAVALTDGAVDAGVAKMPVGAAGHTLAVLSWESLINRLSAAVGKFGDAGGAAELEQIRGLVEWRTAVGWVPLLPEDLPQRVGRQLDAVVDSLKAVCSRASSAKVRNGTADGGFGRHITTPSGKSIWVGTWLRWWDTYGPGPAWAQVSLATSGETATISQALTSAGITHHARPENTDVLIPLLLPLGVEQGAVEDVLLVQLEAVIAAVDELAVKVVEDETFDDET
ncbi:hypothetical protein [Nocardioides sp. SYSU DS0651]|uniref:hypothetical protein n=1 Tax=Nocardioides sp. SYSU DS0651 TaxID=3415955 RepID=UPI003F4AF918